MMTTTINRLHQIAAFMRRAVFGWPADPEWQPTGYRRTTAPGYDQDAAVRAALRARGRTATGRRYRHATRADITESDLYRNIRAAFDNLTRTE
jgi:hypothetical protein